MCTSRCATTAAGFADKERAPRAEDGHVGLRLLGDLIAQQSGTLTVRSWPGDGTIVEMEVPAG